MGADDFSRRLPFTSSTYRLQPVVVEFIEGEWQLLAQRTTPALTHKFNNGESFTIDVIIPDTATDFTVQILFATSWIGQIDTVAASEEFSVSIRP